MKTRTWTYGYDARSNLATVTDPLGRTTDFDHDLVGRTTREESPLGNVTTFSYDENEDRPKGGPQLT